MLNALGQISWLAVALATVASFVLGALWFTVLFGTSYAAALGRTGVPQGKPAAIFIVGPFVWSLLTSVTTAVLMRALGIGGIGDGLLFGAIVGVGYLAATTANTGINPNIPRPGLYGVLSGGYHLAAALIISLILVAVG